MVSNGQSQNTDSRLVGMASDQPVKKKLRIDAPDIDDSSDKSSDNVIIDIFNSETVSCETTEDLVQRNGESPDSGTVSEDAVDCTLVINKFSSSIECLPSSSSCGWVEDNHNLHKLKILQNGLVDHCICRIDNSIVTQLLDRRLHLNQWPLQYSLRFLSTVQLLFDVYLKQNNSGTICSKIMAACDILVRNQHDWITEIIDLGNDKNKYLVFLASRVLSSFLIVSKDTVDESWLHQITENVYLFDTFNRITVQKINFSLDIIKRIVEWKDVEQHPLEESSTIREDNPFRVTILPTTSAGPSSSTNSIDLQNAFSNMNTQGSSTERSSDSPRPFRLQEPVLKFPIDQQINGNESISEQEPIPEPVRLERVLDTGCVTVVLTDSESFDTSHIKCVTIKSLQHHWSSLVKNIKLLLIRYLNLCNAENCILTFFTLWESIISVKANLSVIDTKPFYADLQSFADLLRSTNMPSLIYTQILCLFNEVLCYGSTLALQDILPEEICSLAHSIVRFVKDYRLLTEIQIGNRRSGLGFVGYDSPVVRNYSLEPENGVPMVDAGYGVAIEQDQASHKEVDKNMLQKITLLVLKSVAVTVKEMRCDSSDSSIDSSDYNAIQDMQIVERSIRDVLKKLDSFIKNSLEFHPETPFTKMLVHLFSEQDDFLIESMVCTLDITVGIVYRNSVYPDLIPMLNPIATFIEFLKVVSHDSDVLLDYLVSNETCFLLYLLRFLKYVRRNWPKFLEACQNVDQGGFRGLDNTMSVLIRLRLQISRLVSKSLFPYNISPVLRLLEVCESLYEGNELS